MRSLRGASLGFAIVLLTSSLSPLVAHATWSHDPYLGNTAVCTSPGNQSAQAAVSDGAGGVIVTWTDLRSGTNDIYAQRLNAAGVPLWTSNGVPICVTTGFQ